VTVRLGDRSWHVKGDWIVCLALIALAALCVVRLGEAAVTAVVVPVVVGVFALLRGD